jgi:tryptophanyl-tRNA synthetase
MRPRTVSGIKPTGLPHWGNYFGMIQPAIELAKTHEAFYFVADLHALTTVRDPATLRRDSLGVAATLLACGLDPAQTVIWRQSDVPEVLELTWLLGCVTGMGLLERAHGVKDAESKGKELNFGTFAYPVLMAADILLYDADVVPVGKDQKQHLEMTRDMATYLNVAFFGAPAGGTADESTLWDGKMLKRPQAVIREATALVPGLDGQKMSKSYDNHIPLFASKKELKQRVMGIVTDSTPLEAPKDPSKCNVFALYRLFSDTEEQAALSAKYRGGNFGYGHAKLELLAKAEAKFGSMRERFDALMADPQGLDAVLRDGAARAREVALPVLARVRDAVGMRRRPA